MDTAFTLALPLPALDPLLANCSPARLTEDSDIASFRGGGGGGTFTTDGGRITVPGAGGGGNGAYDGAKEEVCAIVAVCIAFIKACEGTA